MRSCRRMRFAERATAAEDRRLRSPALLAATRLGGGGGVGGLASRTGGGGVGGKMRRRLNFGGRAKVERRGGFAVPFCHAWGIALTSGFCNIGSMKQRQKSSTQGMGVPLDSESTSPGALLRSVAMGASSACQSLRTIGTGATISSVSRTQRTTLP